MKKSWLMSALVSLVVISTLVYSASGYRLLKTIALPGDDSWDYVSVDSVNRRVYVSHSARMEVLDADSGAMVGNIPAPEVEPSSKSTAQGMHGVAVAPELGRGFTSNGRASTMSIFDLKTLKILGEVKVGEDPDGIIYDPASRRAFSLSGKTRGATAIDGAEGKVAGHVDLDARPEAAAADGNGHLFVNLLDKDAVAKIDSKKLTVMERWLLAPCHAPTTMAIDRRNQRLFIGCRASKTLLVVDTENGHVITTLPIGAETDAAAFDPETHLVFSANGEGTVTVIEQKTPDKYSVIDTVKTALYARTMGLDPKTHRLFLSTADREPETVPSPAGQRPPIVPGTFRVLMLGRE